MIRGLIDEVWLLININLFWKYEIRVLRNRKQRFNTAYTKPSSFGDRMNVHSSFPIPFHIIDV